MGKGFISAIFAVLCLFLLAKAAPSPFDDVASIDDFIDTPVRYDGAQLWTVSYSDDKTIELLNSLTEEFG